MKKEKEEEEKPKKGIPRKREARAENSKGRFGQKISQ